MSREFNSSWLLLGLFLLTACATQVNSVAPALLPAPTKTALPPQAPAAAHQTSNCTETITRDNTFGVRNWPNTNFCKHSVAYEEINGILGKDRIAALDNPRFETPTEARLWLTDPELVLLLEINNEARAYPIPILIWHEIVNDQFGDLPVAVTYCPLCNSALVFERRVDGQVLSFGTTGNLRHADLIMYDRETESWWQQFEGEAIVGELTGSRLEPFPSRLVSFSDFRSQFPDGRVLSIDTGFDRRYGENPYINYDAITNSRTRFFPGDVDPRLPPKRRVLAIDFGGTAIAYPYDLLSSEWVINDTRDGHSLVVFWKNGTVSALYGRYIFESTKEIGAAAAFSRKINGRLLTFKAVPKDGTLFQDIETGSRWNFFGTAVSGPLAGQQLAPIAANEFFWFAWAAFMPDTELYEAQP